MVVSFGYRGAVINPSKEFSFSDIEQKSENEFVAHWRVPANLSYLRGHFPDRAIVPAVAILDACVELASLRGAPLVLAEVLSAKFLSPVEPSQQIKIYVKGPVKICTKSSDPLLEPSENRSLGDNPHQSSEWKFQWKQLAASVPTEPFETMPTVPIDSVPARPSETLSAAPKSSELSPPAERLVSELVLQLAFLL